MGDAALPDRLTIAPGASAIVEAPGHGVGGYLWRATVERGPGEIQSVPPVSQGAIGAGAVARFELSWLGDEAGSVILELQRPWESTPLKRHRIAIVPGGS